MSKRVRSGFCKILSRLAVHNIGIRKLRKKPDGIEKGIRFGCGGLLGLIIGGGISFRFFYNSGFVVIGLSVCCFLVAGYFASKKGDHFYDIFHKYF